jgi:uncharacterized phage protein gp47/JayE
LMSYSDKTQAEILADILTEISSEYDKTPGYLPYDMAAALAIELTLVAADQGDILTQAFSQTATGSYLDLHAGEYDIERNAATESTGTVTISGADATNIPAGSLFATPAGVQFETTAEVDIVTVSIDAPVQALIAGTTGNVASAAITEIPVGIPGVTGVTNADPTTGGTDEETDAALRVRLLERVQLPATSGNAAHYKIWAKEVDGIGDANVIALWDGAGTVKIVLIDANKEPASGELVTAVETYVETQRPIGADVTYVAATPVEIDVDATLTLDTDYTVEGVQSDVEDAISAYLAGIAFVKDEVSYAQIGVAILSVEGILDYEDLTINLGVINIEIDETEVAVIGEVTLD